MPVTLHNYEGMVHGFFQMPGVFDQSTALLDELGKEVRGALG